MLSPKDVVPEASTVCVPEIIFFKELPVPIVGQVQMIAVNMVAALVLHAPDQVNVACLLHQSIHAHLVIGPLRISYHG